MNKEGRRKRNINRINEKKKGTNENEERKRIKMTLKE